MFCQFCGKEHLDGAVVCPHCGMLIEQEVAVSAPVATPVAQPTAAPVVEQPKDECAFNDVSKKTLKWWMVVLFIYAGVVLVYQLVSWTGEYDLYEFYMWLHFMGMIAQSVFAVLAFISALKQPNKTLKMLSIIWFSVVMFDALNLTISFLGSGYLF